MAVDRLSRFQFGELAERMRKSGGFTYDPRTKTYPSEGIVVADPGRERVLGLSTEADMQAYVGQHGERMMEEGMHFGGWASGKKGQPSRDVLDVSQVIPVHPRGHHIADVHHRMHVNRQDAANDLATFDDIPNPRAPYTEAEKAYDFGKPDEHGSQMRISARLLTGDVVRGGRSVGGAELFEGRRVGLVQHQSPGSSFTAAVAGRLRSGDVDGVERVQVHGHVNLHWK